MGVIEEDKT
jgi:hypothetical protein